MSNLFRLPPRRSDAPVDPAPPDVQHGFLEFVTCALCLTPYDGHNDNGNRRWFMTSCGHILCDDPLHKHRRNSCTLCGRHGATFYPIDDQLSPELHQWFQPSLSHFDSVTSSIGVLRFQNSQLTSFVRSLKETVAEQKSTMSEAAERLSSLSDQLKETERRVQDLTQRLAEERSMSNSLRSRTAALEHELATYGPIDTTPVTRPRGQHGLAPPPQAGHTQLTPRMQYAEGARPHDPPQRAMSPLITRSQVQYKTVPGKPLPQLGARRTLAANEMPPGTSRQLGPSSQRLHVELPKLLRATQQETLEHHRDQEPTEHPAKRLRLEQSDQNELPPMRCYSRASTVTAPINSRHADLPGHGGRHSSASNHARSRIHPEWAGERQRF